MKTFLKNNPFLPVLLLAALAGCRHHHGLNEPDYDSGSGYGSGRIATQVRHVSDCRGINLRYAGNVFLTQDTEQSILIEADDNIIDQVVAQADNGILDVGLPGKSNSDMTIKIYVSLKTIENLSIEGAGNITAQNHFACDGLTCLINGSGNITIEGSGSSLDCTINGAGNIDAFGFQVNNCVARVNGAGNCLVDVTQNLDASITGVGNITYGGNPQVKSSITGIGRISRR